MQNQSYKQKERRFEPVTLPADFPVWAGGIVSHQDRPIKYLHAHDCLEIGYCYEGSGVFVVEDKILPFSRGDVAFITQHEMHHAQSLSGSVSAWTFAFIKPRELLELHGDLKYAKCDHMRGRGFCNIISAGRFPEITMLVRELMEEINGDRKGRKQLIRNLVSTLLIKMSRMYPNQADESSPAENIARQRIMPALDMILHEFSGPIMIEHLAAKCHLSVSHFRRLFYRAMGISPQEYMIVFRIKLAQRLLTTTSDSILEISLAVGYNTLSSFNRHFRRITGMAPRQCRVVHSDE